MIWLTISNSFFSIVRIEFTERKIHYPIIDPLEDHYYYYNSNPILFSSLIQGDSLHYSITDQGDNIIGVDPLFIDDSLDFNLQSSSPCIESGFNDIVELPEFDLLGNPRIVGGLIDIGAYEFQGK